MSKHESSPRPVLCSEPVSGPVIIIGPCAKHGWHARATKKVEHLNVEYLNVER